MRSSFIHAYKMGKNSLICLPSAAVLWNYQVTFIGFLSRATIVFTAFFFAALAFAAFTRQDYNFLGLLDCPPMRPRSWHNFNCSGVNFIL